MKRRNVLNWGGLAICLLPVTLAGGKSDDPAGLIAKLDCPDRVRDVAFSPDGKLLAAAYGWNGPSGLRIWRVADQSVLVSLGTGDGVQRVAFSPDGKLLAAANWVGDVSVWQVGSWESSRKIFSRRGSPTSLSFSATSETIELLTSASLCLYDWRAGREIELATEPGKTLAGSVLGAALGPVGNALAVCRRDSIEVWNTATRALEKSWKADWPGFICRYSPKGSYFVSGGGGARGGGAAEIWSTPAGGRLRKIADFRRGLFSAAVSHSEELLALAGGTYGGGGDLSLWRLSDGEQIGYESIGRFPISSLAFSPDDQVLAVGSEDGFVGLIAAARVRGSKREEQSHPLCGEVRVEPNRISIVPLAKAALPMREQFQYAWRLEVAGGSELAPFDNHPVALLEWALETDARTNRAVVRRFAPLMPGSEKGTATSNYAVFGDIQNPGWPAGFIAKVYDGGSYVAAKNDGSCLAYGSIEQIASTPSFESLRKRLVNDGLLSVPKTPTAPGTDHYRTLFIELSVNGVAELRSDAEVIDFSKPDRYPTQKQKDFRRIFEAEGLFLDSLLKSGMKTRSN